MKNFPRVLFISLLLMSMFFVLFYCFNGFRVFIITSGSMQPALKPGSLIVTKPQTRYSSGQIIVYSLASKSFSDRQNNKSPIVSHRVHSTYSLQGESIYVTKGDANSLEDLSHVKQSQIIGRVWLSFPLVGLLLAWTHERLSLYPLIILVVFLTIIVELLGYLKNS